MKNLIFLILMLGLFPHWIAAQLWSNPVSNTLATATGSDPYTTGDNIYNHPVTVSGIGRGTGITYSPSASSYRSMGWTTGSSLNTNDYYWFRLTPATLNYIRATSFSFNYETSAQGPANYELRYSLNGFSTSGSVQSGSLTRGADEQTLTITLPASLANITTPVEFRLYAWNAGFVAPMFGIDEFIFNGTVSSMPLPVKFGAINTSFSNNVLQLTWETLSEVNNDHFDIEVSVNGSNFEKVVTVVSQAPAGNSATTLQYKLKIDIKARKLAGMIGFFSLLLFSVKRLRKIALAAVLLTPFIFLGCSKAGNNLQKEGREIIYVRIKQVDIDGQSDYSPVVRAN